MNWKQLLTPNPAAPCKPGWCLKYVQDAFGITNPKHFEGDAIGSWNDSPYKHEDQNFPAGMWVPVWFTVSDNADGHVALRAPDGSVYSASSPTGSSAVHHPSLAALEEYYSGRLTYLGWTEDVEDNLVIEGVDNMSQIGLAEARILAFHIGGRNGLYGESNALNGECDAELSAHHVGNESNADIHEWYDSKEGQNWRSNHLVDLATKASQVATLTATIAQLQQQIASLSQQPAETEIASLKQAASDASAQVSAAQAQADKLAKELQQIKTIVEGN